MSPTTKVKPLKIILAVDGSEHSLAATRFLADLPLLSGSTILIRAVVHSPESFEHTALQSVLGKAQALLDNKAGVEVLTALLEGHPAEELISLANQIEPDLIVLGAQGLKATLRILLGGVAQQVVEYANQPVLVVRAPYSGLRKILLATDGSACSQRAIGFLAQFPLPEGAVVTIAHALPSIFTPEAIARSWPVGMGELPPIPSEGLEEIYNREAERQEEAGKALLAESVGLIEKLGIQAQSVLLRGDTATELIEYASNNQVDLILAGSRGLSPVKSWLLGSISRKLIHYSGCSVLVVKGECSLTPLP